MDNGTFISGMKRAQDKENRRLYYTEYNLSIADGLYAVCDSITKGWYEKHKYYSYLIHNTGGKDGYKSIIWDLNNP